jgi:hypothetical protein
MYGTLESDPNSLIQPVDLSKNNLFLPRNNLLAEEAMKVTVNDFIQRVIDNNNRNDVSFEDGVMLGIRLSTYINKIHMDCDAIVTSVLQQSARRSGQQVTSGKSTSGGGILQAPKTSSPLDRAVQSYHSNKNTNVKRVAEKMVSSSMEEAIRNTVARTFTDDAQDSETLELQRAFEEYRLK